MATPAAMAHAGSASRRFLGISICDKLMLTAFSRGQAATHSRQPVHATDWIFTNLSTGNADGPALEHFTHSMQGSGLRRIFTGLSHEVSP